MHWLSILLLCAISAPARTGTGTVSATTLNVRARPTVKREVIAQVKRGAEVRIVGEIQGWYRIEAPADTTCWVAERIINADGVATADSKVFAGPGPMFAIIGTVSAGDTLRIHKRRADGWVRIGPTADTEAWVSANYIDADLPPEEPAAAEAKPIAPSAPVEPAPAEPTEATEPKAEAAEIKAEPAAPLEMPKAPADMQVHEIRSQPATDEVKFVSPPKQLTKTGVLLCLAEKNKPWAYVLATPMHRTYYPVAYVQWEGKDLSAWEFDKVRIKGVQRFVDGWPRPLFLIEDLEEL